MIAEFSATCPLGFWVFAERTDWPEGMRGCFALGILQILWMGRDLSLRVSGLGRSADQQAAQQATLFDKWCFRSCTKIGGSFYI